MAGDVEKKSLSRGGVDTASLCTNVRERIKQLEARQRLIDDHKSDDSEQRQLIRSRGSNEQFGDLLNFERSPSDPDNYFSVKQTWFNGKVHRMICQNRNGSCPLIALINTLVLKGKIYLPEAESFFVTDLLAHLSSCLCDEFEMRLAKIASEGYGNSVQDNKSHKSFQKVISDVIPDLQTGLNVNCGFHKSYHFKPSDETQMFDILNVKLYHGVCVSEDDFELAILLQDLFFDELADKVIIFKDLVTALGILINEKQSLLEIDDCEDPESLRYIAIDIVKVECDLHDDFNVDSLLADALSIFNHMDVPGQDRMDHSANDRQGEDLDENPPLLYHGSELYRHLVEGLELTKWWLLASNGDMTYEGLLQINNLVDDGEICVLFRNSHFSTIYKNNGRLFTLVTDVGYLEYENITWELLQELDGDTIYYDCNFEVSQFDENMRPQKVSISDLSPWMAAYADGQDNNLISEGHLGSTSPNYSGTTVGIPISQATQSQTPTSQSDRSRRSSKLTRSILKWMNKKKKK